MAYESPKWNTDALDVEKKLDEKLNGYRRKKKRWRMILKFPIQVCEVWMVAPLTKIKNQETAGISKGVN